MRQRNVKEIRAREEEVLQLIRSGGYTIRTLSATLGVSVPTMSRMLLWLRQRGHNIETVRDNRGWKYVLSPKIDGEAGSGVYTSSE